MTRVTTSTSKRNILIIFSVLISTFLTACSASDSKAECLEIPETLEVFQVSEISKNNETPEVWEFKLLSCSIEIREITNRFGRVIAQEKYFHYGFECDGEVIFKEKLMYSTYDYINYRLRFEVTEEEPKIIQENTRSQVVLTFQMTQEMYDKLFITD